jgi:hypothetical protein
MDGGSLSQQVALMPVPSSAYSLVADPDGAGDLDRCGGYDPTVAIAAVLGHDQRRTVSGTALETTGERRRNPGLDRRDGA